MGIVAKAESDAKRVINSPPKKKSGRVVSTSVDVSKATDEFLKLFPVQLRLKVLKQAVRAAGAPVRTHARAKLASHRSRTTGTRAKWSKKIRDKREGQKDLYDSMRIKVKEYGTIVLAMIGPKYPEGAHAHLLEFGGNRVFWGKQVGSDEPEPFMRPAADETKPQQKKAMVDKVKKEWRKV